MQEIHEEPKKIPGEVAKGDFLIKKEKKEPKSHQKRVYMRKKELIGRKK